MTDQYPPWEPPFAGTETEHLLGSLDRLRATFRWKAADLDAAGLALRLPSSSLTVGGLLKHLAAQEDYASAVKVTGGRMPDAWDAQRVGRRQRLGVHHRCPGPAGGALRPLRRRRRPFPRLDPSDHRRPRPRRRLGRRPRRRQQGQRPPDPVRPARGVRPPHRPRRPAPRGHRRPHGRGPARRLAALIPLPRRGKGPISRTSGAAATRRASPPSPPGARTARGRGRC